MLMLKKPGGDWKWCSIGQWQWYMTKWVLAPFFPFILLFVKMGSLFNNGEEWQKLDQGCFIYQEASTSYSGWLASKSKDTSLGKRKFEISPEEKEQFSG